MLERKIIFFRNSSQESSKISKLLDKNKIKFREIYSNSRLTPCLRILDKIYFKGYKTILDYIKTYQK